MAEIPRRPESPAELPLLPRQLRWFNIEKIYPGATSPQVQLSFRLRGPLDVDAWLRAVAAVVDRHEGLRTRFHTAETGPVQVVEPPRTLEVERVEAGSTEEARELLVSRPAGFDLERGDLVRSCLVRLADDDHLWTFTVHHIAADGASLAVIERDLTLLYRAFAAGGTPRLPELPVTPADYAVWRAVNHRPEHDEDHRKFWRKQLAGVPVLDLRTDRPRPDRKGAPTAQVHQVLGENLAQRVESLAAATRCTRFIVLLTALQVVLADWSGQRDFCVGLPVAGSERGHPELANVVAPFNVLLALRCDLSGDPTFTELLTRARGTLLESLMHQGMALADVVEALELPADPSRAQLCQALFLLDEPDSDGLALPGVTVEEFPLPLSKMPYDLMVYTGLNRAGLWTTFHYDSELFTGETVAGRVRELAAVLDAAGMPHGLGPVGGDPARGRRAPERDPAGRGPVRRPLGEPARPAGRPAPRRVGTAARHGSAFLPGNF